MHNSSYSDFDLFIDYIYTKIVIVSMIDTNSLRCQKWYGLYSWLDIICIILLYVDIIFSHFFYQIIEVWLV